MEIKIKAFIYILSLSCIFNLHKINSQQVETYIVHVKSPEAQISSEQQDYTSYYQSFLSEATVLSNTNEPSPRLIYSYQHVLTGFAAKLTATQVKSIEQKDGFLTARPQRILDLHTTHTPNFLGLHQNFGFWQGSNYGKGVIIGVLDTGITPNHPSFNDTGVPPPPKKWKGKCEFEKTFCNNKLIGARSFGEGKKKYPVDTEGHGTHTSSTAAGNFVKGANVFGQAKGTAVGMAPLAHLAMYQVCSEEGCPESDILAAMDTAIEDGVDVLSISIGGSAIPFYNDGIALGAFTAAQKGIFVSCSAGNSGPASESLVNGAPWILTVGASTMDRNIKSTAVLGNKKQYNGETVFQPSDFPSTSFPLLYVGVNNTDSAFCSPGSFNNTDIKGKVVLCERGDETGRVAKGQEVKNAGGAGMILMNDKAAAYSTIADSHVLPAVHVSYAAGIKIKEYINSNAKPTAAILFKGTVIGGKTAAEVTSFSSRGPNTISPGILKPDIVGPGVSVLAAWPNSIENKTGTTSTFNLVSGTSMSCPHLSGIAALIKSAHPDWSPAAIKSAMMTTASIKNLGHKLILDEKQQPADLFAVGAGHVNPSRATDPGIIYDIKPNDYVPYLCGLNYTDTEVKVITNSRVNCSKVTMISEAELNYPSFSVALGSTNLTYTRTVTNVGPANSSYKSFIVNPRGVEVTIREKALKFSETNQKLTYEVTFSRLSSATSKTYVQGYMMWISNTSTHYALSPLSVKLL